MTPSSLPIAASELLPVLESFELGNPSQILRLGGTATPKWDITTPQGRFVLRVRAAEFADEDVTRFDHRVLRQLAEAKFPVPVPKTSSNGSTWHACGGHVYEALSWIDGDSFVEGDEAAIGSLGNLLARFHRFFLDDLPCGKKGRPREDHPDLIRPYLEALRSLSATSEEQRELDAIGRLLDENAAALDAGLYLSLPRSVIHGDMHPGNVRFRDRHVSAVYDFDYLGVQARVRDISDAIISFASHRRDRFDPNAIGSLVQPYVPDLSLCRVLLGAYQDLLPLTNPEWQALPWLMRSRWIQMRLRGARKIGEDQRVSFVLDRFFEVIDWLDREGDVFIEGLKEDLQNAS